MKRIILLFAAAQGLSLVPQLQAADAAAELSDLTLLVKAAYEGNLEALKNILPKVESPDSYITDTFPGQKEKLTLNALSAAAFKKQYNIVEYLTTPSDYTEKVAINSKDPNKNISALFWAVRGQKKKTPAELKAEPYIAKLLMDRGASGRTIAKLNATPTPLFVVAMSPDDNDELANILLEKVDPDVRNRNGDTALHVAIEKENTKIAQLLAGITNIRAKNKKGETPRQLALAKNNNIVAETLATLENVNRKFNPTPEEQLEDILAAIQGPNPAATTKTLLSFYSQPIPGINKMDADGYTPLMHAVLKQNPDLVSLLLEYGAKTDITSQAVGVTGFTALGLAERFSFASEKIDLMKAILQSASKPPKPPVTVDSKELQNSLSALTEKLTELAGSLSAGK